VVVAVDGADKQAVGVGGEVVRPGALGGRGVAVTGMRTQRRWKPTQQENLWFHGGNLHQSRHYSLYLALQLKARYERIPTPVYRLAEVHHLS